MRIRAIVVTLGFAALLAFPAWAGDADEPGKLAAVQKRKFRLDHEIFAAATLQPLDSFFKGLGPTVSYTAHISDVLGWEVVRGSYSFNFETSLREQLRKDYGVAPTRFDKLQWMVGTAAMLTPLYGKLSLANRSVVHSEIYFILGGSVGKFELGQTSASTSSYKPGPQVGAGLRVFLSESVSVRAEGRYHYLISRDPTQVVDLALGLAFNLGGAD